MKNSTLCAILHSLDTYTNMWDYKGERGGLFTLQLGADQ